MAQCRSRDWDDCCRFGTLNRGETGNGPWRPLDGRVEGRAGLAGLSLYL